MRLGVAEGGEIPPDQSTFDSPAFALKRERLSQGLERLYLELEDQWQGKGKWLREQLPLTWPEKGEPHWTASVTGRFSWLIYPENPYPKLATTGKEQGRASAETRDLPTPAEEPEDAGRNSSPPSPRASSVSLAREQIHDVKLFVWLRGAYRNTGLGRPAVGEVLRNLPALLKPPFRLHVELPLQDQSGPGEKLQKAMWLTFYQHHEFRIYRAKEKALKRDF